MCSHRLSMFVVVGVGSICRCWRERERGGGGERYIEIERERWMERGTGGSVCLNILSVVREFVNCVVIDD